MSVTDPIADLLTSIRNATRAKKRWVVVPASNMKRSLVEVLEREKFIRSFQVVEEGPKRSVKIYLKYTRENESVIANIQRVSRPGRRMYVKKDNIPRVLGGLGTAVLSTSRGVVTDKEARSKGLGGEWVCTVW